jgi:Fe-S-cluster containining protein
MSDGRENPWRTWYEAARRPAVDAALGDLYRRLADEIEQRGPTCWISGRCCNFDDYGHRLYVTGLEAAWMWRYLDDAARQRLVDADDPANGSGCPFQIDRLCRVHALRPLGCRIFFCDPGARDWQNPVYERLLNALRQLHEQHDLAYRYLEWRQALAAVRSQLADGVKPAPDDAGRTSGLQ